MSWEQPFNPRDVPPEEVVDRCKQCGAAMELVVRPTLVIERCAMGHTTHAQLCYPESFATG